MISTNNDTGTASICTQYNNRPCFRLLCVLKNFKFRYEDISHMPFSSFWGQVGIRNGGDFLSTAANSLLSILKSSGLDTDHEESVDPTRHWYDMTLGDIAAFGECLNYSLRGHYLLVHYADNIHWHNSYFGGREDIWDIYDGLLRECRSSVIDLIDISYASLPFPKFFNIGEIEECSLAKVEELIAAEMQNSNALIEFSEKLDGSFIQMRYIGNNELFDGLLISTSGTLYTEIAHQLSDVINWLQKHVEYTDIAKDLSHCTIIYEWIDPRDPHIVNYGEDKSGLHLIGIRDVSNGYLYSYEKVEILASQYGLMHTQTYSLDLKKALLSMETARAKEHEGYVMRIGDSLFKVKSKEYVQAMHDVENAKSFNYILRRYTDNTLDDFIASLPESFRGSARTAAYKIGSFEERMTCRINAEYRKIPPNLSHKEAMVYINSINDRYSMIREGVRSRYLNRPVTVLFKENKSGERKYIKESTIDQYLDFLN